MSGDTPKYFPRRNTVMVNDRYPLGIRRNRTLSPDDFTDAIGRNVYLASERVDAQFERFHEFLAQYFARRNGFEKLRCHGFT